MKTNKIILIIKITNIGHGLRQMENRTIQKK